MRNSERRPGQGAPHRAPDAEQRTNRTIVDSDQREFKGREGRTLKDSTDDLHIEPETIRKALLAIGITDGREVFELAANTRSGHIRGRFDSIGSAIQAIEELEALTSPSAFYVVPNLLGPHAEPSGGSFTSSAARDCDIVRRRQITVDIDVVDDVDGGTRPRKAPATYVEQGMAMAGGLELRNRLEAMGMPRPVVVASGNGCQLHFGFDASPTDDRARQLIRCIKRIYCDRGLGLDNTGRILIAIDGSTANPGTLARLAGTLNRKGPKSTGERPWRIARLVDVGDGNAIAPEKLDEIIAELEAAASRAGLQSRGRTGRTRSSPGISTASSDSEPRYDRGGFEWIDVVSAVEHAMVVRPNLAHERTSWINVGRVLHFAAPPGSEKHGEAFDLWERFSRASNKYEPGCCERGWKSFANCSPLTPAWLYSELSGTGWRKPSTKKRAKPGDPPAEVG